jgi:hypothetical protein
VSGNGYGRKLFIDAVQRVAPGLHIMSLTNSQLLGSALYVNAGVSKPSDNINGSPLSPGIPDSQVMQEF